MNLALQFNRTGIRIAITTGSITLTAHADPSSEAATLNLDIRPTTTHPRLAKPRKHRKP